MLSFTASFELRELWTFSKWANEEWRGHYPSIFTASWKVFQKIFKPRDIHL